MAPSATVKVPLLERQGWGKVAATVWLVAVTVVLFNPRSGGAPPFAGADKVIHAILFAGVALTWRWGGAGRWMWVVGLALAVGSEIVQDVWLPARSGDWRDAIADGVGLVIGAWMFAGLTSIPRWLVADNPSER